MARPRIIPVLLLKDGGLVKSVKFGQHNYIGDPLNAVKIFNDLKVDEIILLDISATKNKRTIDEQLIREIGEEANMPFSVGGGISNVNHIKSIIQAGAERVIIGNSAALDTGFIKKACEQFGSSTISVCIDIKRNLFGKRKVVSNNGRTNHNIDPIAFAQEMERCGVGELIIQSVDRDGTMNGYDLSLTKEISDSVSISIVALGGAGNLQHFKELYEYIPVSGIASGSKFVYQNHLKGVLINYPTTQEISNIYATG